MTVRIPSPAPAPEPARPLYGHCSRCGKIWTREQRQGVCPFCGKPASRVTRKTQPRHSHSNRSRSRKQQPVLNTGYDQLQGKWQAYYKVASRFESRVPEQDRQDILHDIFITLNTVQHNEQQPMTEALMYRIASRTVADYWFKHYQITAGLDCRHCSKEQRQHCKRYNLYEKCPKAIKLESLNKPITDSDGNITELGELIVDDKAIDLAEWTDIRTYLLGFPQRLLEIADKIRQGEALSNREHQYLWYWRKREQKILELS